MSPREMQVSSPWRTRMMLACASVFVASCCHTQSPDIADAETSAKFAMCEDMESALKPRLKIGAFFETVAGGGGALFDLGRPQVAAEQVRSLRAMVFECQLWARGEPGHDADRLSDTILRLSGVYVAAPDSAERDARLKSLEQAIAGLSKSQPSIASPMDALTPVQREALLAAAAKLADNPEAMATIRQAVESDTLRASRGTTRLEIWKVYSTSKAEAEDLERVSGLISASEKEISGLKTRLAVLERPEPRAGRTYVLFASNASVVDQAAQQILQDLAGRSPKPSVRVIGYADSTGPSAHNHQLSQARALAVTDFLTAAGVEVVETSGSGPTTLFAGGPASNRRVVVEMLPSQ